MNHSDKIEKYSRIGIASKGVVYLLAGGLTFAGAIGIGGKNSGTSGSFEFVSNQPFGKIILILIALGLLGYVVYRFLAAFHAGNGNENDKEKPKIWGQKLRYIISGVAYGLIAFSALKMALADSGNGGDSNQRKELVGMLLQSNAGQIVLFIIALALVGKAIFQFYIAWSGKFTKHIKTSSLKPQEQKVLRHVGLFGYNARGVVVAIIAYLFFRAVINANPSEAESMEGSFHFIQQGPFGNILLAVISAGLFAYGIYMFVKAKYRYIEL